MVAKIKKIFQKYRRVVLGVAIGAALLATFSSLAFYRYKNQQLASHVGQLGSGKANLQEQLATISQEFEELKNEDQFVRNEELQKTIKNIETTYHQAVKVYENLLSGAFAGINGTYFCPAAYPSCAGKTNTFEFLVMNKNKVYFNSDKNVYSTIPAAIFHGNTARFVTQSLQWGRDTGADAVIANYPLLLLNGQIMFGGSGDPKLNSRGSRSFVGTTGNTVYIGVVHNVSVTESAQVLKALGLNHTLNLDNGSSTALWSGGYKVGPGRNLPNVVLLVKK